MSGTPTPPVKITRITPEEAKASVKRTIKQSKPGLLYLADK